MTIDFFVLIPSIILLLFPRRWLTVGKRLFGRSRTPIRNPRDDREPGDSALRVREEFKKLRNYIDLLRGIAGSYGVMQFAFTLPETPEMSQRLALIAVKTIIIVSAVLVQTLRFEQRLYLVAPCFFVCGVSAGISGLDTALYGGATAWVLNLVLPSPSAFLVVQAICIGAFGAFFHGPFARMVVFSGMINILPALVAFALRKPLSVAAKRQRG